MCHWFLLLFATLIYYVTISITINPSLDTAYYYMSIELKYLQIVVRLQMVFGVCLVRCSPRVRFHPNDTPMAWVDVKICDLCYLGSSGPDMRSIVDHSEQCLHWSLLTLMLKNCLAHLTRVC
jgi:hypothetical protein